MINHRSSESWNQFDSFSFFWGGSLILAFISFMSFWGPVSNGLAMCGIWTKIPGGGRRKQPWMRHSTGYSKSRSCLVAVVQISRSASRAGATYSSASSELESGPRSKRVECTWNTTYRCTWDSEIQREWVLNPDLQCHLIAVQLNSGRFCQDSTAYALNSKALSIKSCNHLSCWTVYISQSIQQLMGRAWNIYLLRSHHMVASYQYMYDSLIYSRQNWAIGLDDLNAWQYFHDEWYWYIYIYVLIGISCYTTSDRKGVKAPCLLTTLVGMDPAPADLTVRCGSAKGCPSSFALRHDMHSSFSHTRKRPIPIMSG